MIANCFVMYYTIMRELGNKLVCVHVEKNAGGPGIS